MATIYIDNTAYEVDEADNLLSVCLGLGFDLPYFCWHPAMGSVGACRQCAVKLYKDENDDRGQLVMACMTPSKDGTRISIQEPEASAFRKSVIEWLMVNHPHDCPVCEEGGECHLQDMTFMAGHVYRRYRFKKRTFRNQYLGPFINHEMNRCIACYRCTRFYRDYAGGDDLQAFAAHNHVYFGRHEDGTLQSEFSGNLVEVCPTGVFTDATLGADYTRKWDLRASPSVCTHCGLGCNISPNERYGELRRIVNRYHHEINGYFICDRGRFGYGFVNRDDRLRQPLVRKRDYAAVQAPRHKGERPMPVPADEANACVLSLLKNDRTVGIGSPRASVEANYALRTLVGAENFHHGMSDSDACLARLACDVYRQGPAPAASLRDAEQADAVLVLGEDLTHTAPRLALSLRQAVRQEAKAFAVDQGIPAWMDNAVRDAAQQARSPLFIASVEATPLDEVAAETYHAAPDDVARLGFAVAHAVHDGAPAVSDCDDRLAALAQRIARTLVAAERPLIVSGYGCQSPAVMQAAANVARALHAAGRPAACIHLTVPEGNSLGAALMESGDLVQAFQRLHAGQANGLIVLENDLYRRAPRAEVEAAINAAEHIAVLDSLPNETTACADVVLPAAPLPENDGTLVNSEGRAQRFFQTYPAPAEVRESWRWLRDIAQAAGRDEVSAWRNLDDVTNACAAELPVFRDIPGAAPQAEFRKAGMKLARLPHRASGRTAMHAHIDVSEARPEEDSDSALSFTMEGYHGRQPAPLIPYFWAPRWNSEQSVNKFQDEIAGPLRGDPGGVSLIEPVSDAPPRWFDRIPPPFERRDDAWLVVPLHRIFGSEELSARSPAVAERVPPPSLAMNPEDAAALQRQTGEWLHISVNGNRLDLPVTLHGALPRGVVGWPAGFPDVMYQPLPAWGRITAKKTS